MGKYGSPVEISDGIFWVGTDDEGRSFHSLPYLVVNGKNAVLIDGGSRSDFPGVMSKILQVGINPNNITALIYQHYDPDLCGSLLNLLDVCSNPDIEIYTDSSSRTFLSHYIHSDQFDRIKDIRSIDFRYVFSGRELQFLRTPYAHAPGSFVTYDLKTKTLFTSDLFGSESSSWDLFVELSDYCTDCHSYEKCPHGMSPCPIPAVLSFNRWLMPCTKALSNAMSVIEKIDIEMIAPQHGSILKGKRDVACLIGKMKNLDNVGIDGVEDSHCR